MQKENVESINKAIGIACENRYKWTIDVTLESILLDPDFWKALGVGLNWKEDNDSLRNTGWYLAMHDLIDHIADGGDINEYFEELCKEK